MYTKLIKLCVAVLLLSGCDFFNSQLSKLVIQTDQEKVTYHVETAKEYKELVKGLMNRESLAKNSGMIFILNGKGPVAMWMKDTLIPLDMLFMDKEGKILWIYENAEPMSTKIIIPQASEEVFAILELNGGEVAKHGIKIGDTIKHRELP